MHNELTKKDIQMMKEELDYRRIQLRPQLLEAVKEARAFGDLSENFEYCLLYTSGMKRLWIAALLLAVLFGATLCNNLYLRGFTGALNTLLEQAEARAETGRCV